MAMAMEIDGTSIIKVIYQCIRQLNKMQDLIFQRDESPPLSQGESLDEEILGIKCSVVHQLEMLFEEGSQNSLPTTHSPPSSARFPTAETAYRVIPECIESLLIMRHIILQTHESLDKGVLCNYQSIVVGELRHIFKEPEEEDSTLSDDDDDDDDDYDDELEAEQEKFRWSSEDGMKGTRGRYLCVSNGFEIWCLDLKQSRNTQGLGPLPKIASLNLLGGELPASLGLFNLGSRAYVIGGKELPSVFEDEHLVDAAYRGQWDKKTKGMELYRALSHTRGVRGSSCLAFRLSLVSQNGDCILSPSELSRKDKIKNMNKPKFWPIVEKSGGKLHVIDSLPYQLGCYYNKHTFSHEVCNMSKGGWQWEEIVTLEEDRIHSYVVVGDRIYAVTPQGVGKGCYFLEFDSLKGGWKRCGRPVVQPWRASKMNHVWNIISLGIARCAGEFPHPHEKLFVLVALVFDFGPPDFSMGPLAAAYLVTSEGRVLCYQLLPEFFVKDEQLLPYRMIAGTMIHVNEEEHKGTMCSVFSSTILQDGKSSEHLFVNTFFVKMRSCVADKVREILVEKAGEVEIGPPVELEFVRVVVKNRFIYQTGASLEIRGEYKRFVDWRACFLTPSLST